MKLRVTVWTDFNIPSTRDFEGPHAYQDATLFGNYCIRELGCSRFTIKEIVS